MARVTDVLKRLRKLSPEEQRRLDALDWCVSASEKKIIRGFVKERKLSLEDDRVSIGGLIDPLNLIKLIPEHPDLKDLASEVNKKIGEKTSDILFRQFSSVVHDQAPLIIAPNIVGFENVKKAVALQLFSPEHIHILLLGDPGTGKTDILTSATELSEISSMGLGSGTSSVGLSVTVKGKEVKKGLLPLADKGLCAIDELNLMKEESRASLYNAMEKGFVSYDKGGNSFRFDSRISVLATANPKGDKFAGSKVKDIKKQLPFDSALLSRFHLTFFVRKHDVEQFKQISRSLLSKKKLNLSEKEKGFLMDYIRKARELDPSIPKNIQQEIVDFVGDIKEKESDYLIEISPRTVVGFSRMVKASARMELRDKVEKKDLDFVKDIFLHSLKIA